MNDTQIEALRTRLEELRDDLIHRLVEAETFEPAWLGMLADIDRVLELLEGAKSRLD